MKKMIFSAILMLGFANQVSAANWVRIGGNSEMVAYADVDSRTQDRAWFEYRFTKPQKLPDGRYFINLRHLSEFSCNAKTTRMLTAIWYTKTYAVVESYTPPYHQIKDQYIAPSTVADNMYQFVCSHYPQ